MTFKKCPHECGNNLLTLKERQIDCCYSCMGYSGDIDV